MSFLGDFGAQAANDGWGILTDWAKQEVIDTPTITDNGTTPAQAAGQPTNDITTDPRNNLDGDMSTIDVFGLHLNRTAVNVALAAVSVTVLFKLAKAFRG